MPTREVADQIDNQEQPLVATTRPTRPPLPELAGAVSREFSIRSSQGEIAEFKRLWQREIAKLAHEWVPIGQSRTVPKRLTENVRYFYRDFVVFAWNSQPDATKELRLLLRSIRIAVDRVKVMQHERETANKFNKPLYNKTVTFLKRLAHDKTFNDSAKGARKYRNYVIQKKIKARLKRPICDEVTNDLGESWQARRVRSQQQLLDIGKALALCVGHKNEQTRRYFRVLVTGESEFWQILADGRTKGLLEVHCDQVYGDCSILRNYRCVGELNGHSHCFLQLPYQVAATLVQKLKLHPLSSVPLFNSGVFPSFITGLKDKDRPDFSIALDQFRYTTWIAEDELIISRTKSVTDGYTDTEAPIEWGYFARACDDKTLDPPRIRPHIDELPPQRLEGPRTTLRQHRFSAVSIDEVLTVLAAQLKAGEITDH
ncbi:MAG: hypothetical protein OXG05_04435 [Gammaproteobacteria bacterium]|nr:hypothetical protein [Gammaproteobacteria bacterium]